MFTYIRNKIRKFKARRVFREYGYEIKEFSLPVEGSVKYAQWLNPFEKPHIITQSRVDFFKKFVKKGDFAIDIGAHTGDTTIPIALAAGKEGQVLALDPNPVVFKILEVNTALNTDKTAIRSLCCAATDTTGEFYYNSSEASFNNGGVSSEKRNKNGKFLLQQKIKGINLLEYLNENYSDLLSKLAFIKIDTEGYDKEVLKSINPVIEKYRPVIVTECFGKLTKVEREELFDLIAQHRYTLFYFEDFEINTVFQAIQKEDMMNWKHFDIYAVPAEK